MAKGAPADGDWPVLELGPGTGPVTAALIARGIAPERIVAVEFNPDFCSLLVERFRGLNVVEGDAYDLAMALPPGLDRPLRGGRSPRCRSSTGRLRRASRSSRRRSTACCPAAGSSSSPTASGRR